MLPLTPAESGFPFLFVKEVLKIRENIKENSHYYGSFLVAKIVLRLVTCQILAVIHDSTKERVDKS